MGCSAHCPLRMLGCVRRPVAELNGCQEANWCGRVDFCTGGFGRGRARPCHGLVGRGFDWARGGLGHGNKDPVGGPWVGEASQNFVRLQRHFGCWGSFLTKNCESIIGVGKLQELETSSESDEMENSDRKSTRLNSSHSQTSYAAYCLKKNSSPAVVRRGPA